MKLFPGKYRTAGACLLLVGWVWHLQMHGGEADLSPTKTFRRLRKDFLMYSPLPPATRGYRREHLDFLRSSTAFIKSLSKDKPEDKSYLIATYGLRGSLLFNCENFARARQDFDQALNLLPPPPEDGAPPAIDLPLGAMKPTAIRLLRAFTFADEGTETFLNEVKDIPPAQNLTGTIGLSQKIRSFAEKLAQERKLDEAIAVYEILDKHQLWDEDKDQDPKRMIEILKTQKENQSF